MVSLQLLQLLFWIVQVAWGKKQDYFSHPNWDLLPHDSCGQTRTSSVSGGAGTIKNDLPWLVRIYHHLADYGQDAPHVQGNAGLEGFGTIISDRYVLASWENFLTAVDPLQRTVRKYFSVGMGPIQKIQPLTERKYYDLESVVTHPNLSACLESPLDRSAKNDIVLLRLKDRIIFTDDIQPICLPFGIDTKKFGPDTQFETASWGVLTNVFNTDNFDFEVWPEVSPSSAPTSSEVTIRPKSECSVRHQTYVILTHEPSLLLSFWWFTGKAVCYLPPPDEHQLCVSEATQSELDYGAPLVKAVEQEGKNTYFIFGIGPMDRGLTGPLIYTGVSGYLGWILDSIKP